MKCHKCGIPMTLYVVGEDYCFQCKARIKEIEAQDARRRMARARFSVVKDLTPWGPSAA